MHLVFKLSILAALLVGAALFVRGPATPAQAYPGSEGLAVAGGCNPDGTLTILITWTAYNTGPQYLDFSLYNNGFAPEYVRWIWSGSTKHQLRPVDRHPQQHDVLPEAQHANGDGLVPKRND